MALTEVSSTLPRIVCEGAAWGAAHALAPIDTTNKNTDHPLLNRSMGSPFHCPNLCNDAARAKCGAVYGLRALETYPLLANMRTSGALSP